MKKTIAVVVLVLVVGVLALSVARAVHRKMTRQETQSIDDVRKETGVPVMVASPFRTNMAAVIVLDGTVEPRERAFAEAGVDERVSRVYVDEGDPVSAGNSPTLLLEFDDKEAQAGLQAAQAAHTDAGAKMARAQALFQEGGISRQEFDQARVGLASARANLVAADKQLAKCRLYAPITGIVSERIAQAGTVPMKADLLMVIVDTAELKVEAKVPEKLVRHLSAGMPCSIEFGADGEHTAIAARISSINPELDPVSRELTVTCRLASPPDGIVPGMYARVRVQHREKRGVLAVPEEAEVEHGGKGGVYVVTPGGLAEFRPLQTGLRENGRVEVVSGLKTEDRIVVDGNRQISDGTKVLVME